METIFALATAQGRAGVSIIRISGPDAFDVARTLCGSVPKARSASVRTLRSQTDDVIDHALVISFDAPASFTGENIVEFQVHGSVAVVRAVLSALKCHPLARSAEPGEFTRRALENNKLNLSQIEGLADLIDAETEAQRKQAVRVFSGAFGEKIEKWRRNLIWAAALLEATIDFADEDVPVDVTEEVGTLISKVRAEVEVEIQGSFVAERIRNGFEIALVGAPNTGKSTLLNRLAGREAAITSDVAGTTRDVIEVRMDLGGLPVTFLDTAGLRESSDAIESIGIQRAIDRAKQADLRVFLAGEGEDLPVPLEFGDIQLVPKADMVGTVHMGISGKTGLGVSELLDRIQVTLINRASSAGLATHERHRSSMEDALEYLSMAQNALSRGPEIYDIAAEELRFTIRALEVLVGRIDVENVLDEIFSSFCLGK